LNKQLKIQIEFIKPLNAFDDGYYLSQFDESDTPEGDLIEHYFASGWSKGKNPCVWFDTNFYLEEHKDVKAAGVNPFFHYLKRGIHEKRRPNGSITTPEIDKVVSATSLEDKLNCFIECQTHNNKESVKDILIESVEGVDEQESEVSSSMTSIDFDVDFYFKENPDVSDANMDPEKHYYEFGESEGRMPNEYFDPKLYYKLNADVRGAKLSAFKHYREFGFNEGRAYNRPLRKAEGINKSKLKKSLLFVGHDGITAGAQKVLLDVVRWFSEHTDRVVKILLLNMGPMVRDYALYGEVYTLYNKQVDDFDSFSAFIEDEFEFVYLSTVVSGRYIQLLKQYNLPVNSRIISNIHEMEKVLSIFPDEMSELKKHTTHWISGSKHVTNALYQTYHIDKSDITTIPAFITPVADYEYGSNSLKKYARKQLNIEGSNFVVMGCGTAYWRKGPDIFLQTARELRQITNESFHFVWIGDGEDKQELELSLTPREREYISFVGHRENADLLLAAADIFFLSSREDPFPLVVLLSAQHCVPTICFKNNTGIDDFIKTDAGICLDDQNAALTAQKIHELMKDRDLINILGKNAQHRLLSSYTTEIKMIEVFEAVRGNTDYKPSVSVIIPFYNHEKFLDERFQSILNQSLKDIEIIALDDCSTDGSLIIAEKYLNDPRLTLIGNGKNSGSPFVQWEKGIKLAKSDIVWIAEGDDSCSKNFLESLIPYFENELVNIASAKTEMIDEKSELKKHAFDSYFEQAHSNKFENSYIIQGIQEVNEQLGAVCTLINASGLLIRKSSFGSTLARAQSFKMCGDWLIYLECLKEGKLAYDVGAINYFRRHSASQVKKIEGTKEYFYERQLISEYVFSEFKTSKQLLIRAFSEINNEIDRFAHLHETVDQLYDHKYIAKVRENLLISRKILPNIAVVVSDLGPGGGQVFAIRLANAWMGLGGRVVLLNVNKYESHKNVIQKINPEIPIINLSNNINDVCLTYDIDIIHSSLWWADKYIHENFMKIPERVRWVVTMHGCYESLVMHPDTDGDFIAQFIKMQFEVDHWVYIAQKNMKAFDVINQKPLSITKILNGYEAETPKSLEKEKLGIREDAFVFCLVSRAISSKGWGVACEAITNLNREGYKFDLLLVGSGEYEQVVSDSYNYDFIHSTGQVSNVEDYISISDVCMLPSFFIGESMPLVLIEYMAQSKPIISSNIGEIVNMTCDSVGDGAIILDLENDTVNVGDLQESMIKLYEDNNLYQDLSRNSGRNFKKFEMSIMIEEYRKLYSQLIS
tara:strand:- start:4561 stop:8376 length:3816 start_codon:yes stop_codon:yes gene_type:complete